jgi:hypothetical protein
MDRGKSVLFNDAVIYYDYLVSVTGQQNLNKGHFWNESLTIKPENQEKTCSSTKMLTKNPTKAGFI